MKTCSMHLCTEVAELTFTFSKLTPHNKSYALAILRSLIFAQENGNAEEPESKKIAKTTAKKSTKKNAI